LFLVADKKEQSEPHQAANERVHGVVADRAAQDMPRATGHAQRGDIEKARYALENPNRPTAETVHRRSRDAETDAPQRVSGLQIQASQENAQKRHRRDHVRTGRHRQDHHGGRGSVKVPEEHVQKVR